MIRFEVYGKVKGKPRPRVNKNGRVWVSKEFVYYEKLIAQAYKQAGGTIYDGPVKIEIITYREMPKSRPKKLLSEPDTYKPDLDNIIKIVLDGLNGVAYKDDSQVINIKAEKAPRTRGPEYMVVMVSNDTE